MSVTEAYVFPLSSAQRRLWVLSQFQGAIESYNISATYVLTGPLNIDALKGALKLLLQRHDSLRTRFEIVEDEAVQVVDASIDLPLVTVDMRTLSAIDQQTRLDEEVAAFSRHRFDLQHGPLVLFKILLFSQTSAAFLLSMHHIISDGWSMKVFVTELTRSYLALAGGRLPALDDLRIQYGDYAVWQNSELTAARLTEQREFWKDYLAGSLTFLNLPTDLPRPSLQSFDGDSVRFQIPVDTSDQIRSVAQFGRASMFMTMLTVFAVLLRTYADQTDILIGCPADGRNRPELESLIGFFVNTLVVRIDLSGTCTFREILKRVRASVLAAHAHQDMPFDELTHAFSSESSLSYNPLFQVMFAYESDEFGSLALDALSLRRIPLEASTSKFDLTMTLTETNDGLKGEIEFKTALFYRPTIERMARHFENLASGIARNPDLPIDAYEILTTAERTTLLGTWNATERDYPLDGRISDLVVAQANQRGEKIAIRSGDRQVTYATLVERGYAFASTLKRMGVHPGSVVGVYLPPCLEMVVTLLGIHLAGAAYLPLDPDYPPLRLEYMVKDSGVSVLVCDSESSPPPSSFSCDLFDWQFASSLLEQGSGIRDADLGSARDLAYLIYTSGSTGVPKGVEIEHRSVLNLLFAVRDQLQFREEDTMLAVTSLSFDISVLELFLPLCTGGTLYIAPRQAVSDGEKLSALVESSGATFMQATPSTWRLLQEAQWEGNLRLTVLCGGEALPVDLARWLADRGARVWNMYGPTETTIWSLCDPIEKGATSISIGRPLANTALYVLDHNLRPLPLGIPGELCIAGAGVARGYRNDDAKTKERFITVQFGQFASTRMYRTGDQVRYLPDGRIEFLGRRDNQIKLRGRRIDLGEVETILRGHPKIREAVVQMFNGSAGEPELVSYITLVATDDESIVIQDLRLFLNKQLPEYMVPSVFQVLPALPLTPNGKIDRKALNPPSHPARRTDVPFVPPGNIVETQFVKIWQEVLGVERVGIYDNFFDLGGASLTCVRVVNKLRKTGLNISPEDVFQHQTISDLARRCSAATIFDAAVSLETQNEQRLLSDINIESYFDEEPRPSSPATHSRNMLIESLGTYLPAGVVNSSEIIEGCRNEVTFPLEWVTGIKSRRTAAPHEFSIDLARNAILDALSRSHYGPEDIDLLICCNISRYDGPKEFTFEPSTSSRLARELGFTKALTMDVSNACPGMFTGIYVAKAFFANGRIRSALVASGEFITHLASTAQQEVESYLDSRIACLTLGDAGAAVILEEAPNQDVGFSFLEMQTFGRLSDLCIGMRSTGDDGGVIMYTDAVQMAASGYEPSARHTLQSLKRARWKPETIDHLIMHQTSKTTIDNARTEINKLFGREICDDRSLINNVTYRGNTATTSHFIALMDQIRDGKIRSDVNLIFSISGSGMTFGTALYKMDNLPDLIRGSQRRERSNSADLGSTHIPRRGTGVTFESIGIALNPSDQSPTSMNLLETAALACLRSTAVAKEHIGLLIYAGVYRTDFVVEPSIASILAGKLALNASPTEANQYTTLAFDLFDGSIGFLKACQVAVQLIETNDVTNAMLVSAEIENNRGTCEPMIGLAEVGSAVLLSRSSGTRSEGFSAFHFEQDPQGSDLIRSSWSWKGNLHYIRYSMDPGATDVYVHAIVATVGRFLAAEHLQLTDIAAFIPPQISEKFIVELANALQMPIRRFIICDNLESDLYSSSIPFAMKQALNSNAFSTGDLALIITVGSGSQVGLALYTF